METLVNYLFEIPFDVLMLLINLVEIQLYLVLFYAIYRILLRNHTFFKLNRFYLIASLVLSLTLPFVMFTETTTTRQTMQLEPAPPQAPDFQPTTLQFDTGGTDWEMALLIAYGSVALFMCFKLFKGFYKLTRIVRKNECLKFDEYNLVLLPETQNNNAGFGSFSFFKWLVVSYKDYENHLETILQHEFVHIRQWHSLDILLVETLKIVFWVNPVLWYYKFSLCEVHEFLADERAENRDTYANFLIAYAQKSANLNITNQFSNASLLKGRIKMIYTNRSSRLSLIKYLMIIPLIGFITYRTAARGTIYITEEQTPTDTPGNQANTYKHQKTEGLSPSEISSSSNISFDKEPSEKPNSNDFKIKGKANKSSNIRKNSASSAIKTSEENAQDTLSEKKTKFINYRILPIEMNEVKPFFPTLANSKEERTKFMNFSTNEVPKIEVKFTPEYQKAYNGPRFSPVKYHKEDFPK